MQTSPGTVIDGKYRLGAQIASGGMGSVWKAHHTKLDAQVAVKFMATEMAKNDMLRARFEREAKAAARLRSPHVVQVLDYGVEDDMPFIVMELLEGEDLRSRLKRRGALALREAATIVTGTCKALGLAKKEGIIHRDLKPANIFLARSADDEVVKILDFGVAKAMTGELGDGTTSGILLGSPHYMSPEQARGHELDHRSDLFSLAVITFQMLTGKRPFRGKDVGDVIVKICTDPVPRPSHLVTSLPKEVDDFFEKAMAREPDARFQSAAEMANAFSTIVANHTGEPVPSISGTLAMPGMRGSLPSGAAEGEMAEADAPVASTPGTLTAATRSVAIPAPAGRGSKPWLVAAAALVVVGVAVFVFTRSPAPSPEGAPASEATLDAAPAPLRAPPLDDRPEPSAETSAPPPEPPASATAMATSSASVAAPPPTPRPVVRPPTPKAPPRPRPPVAPPTGKHPVLGI